MFTVKCEKTEREKQIEVRREEQRRAILAQQTTKDRVRNLLK